MLGWGSTGVRHGREGAVGGAATQEGEREVVGPPSRAHMLEKGVHFNYKF